MGKAKRKGRVGGAAMMIGLFFATLFDPKKAAAVVHIDTQRRIGGDKSAVRPRGQRTARKWGSGRDGEAGRR